MNFIAFQPDVSFMPFFPLPVYFTFQCRSQISLKNTQTDAKLPIVAKFMIESFGGCAFQVLFVSNAQAVSEQTVGVSAFVRRKHMVSIVLRLMHITVNSDNCVLSDENRKCSCFAN